MTLHTCDSDVQKAFVATKFGSLLRMVGQRQSPEQTFVGGYGRASCEQEQWIGDGMGETNAC